MKLPADKIALLKRTVAFNIKDDEGNTTDVLIFRRPMRSDMQRFATEVQKGDAWYAAEMLVRLCCVSHEVAELDVIADEHASLYNAVVAQLMKSNDVELVATKKASAEPKT